MRLQLSHGRHKVGATRNGAEGLAKSKMGKCDLVMTDYSMLKMKGVELAHAIKRQDLKQPIVLMTGYAFSSPICFHKGSRSGSVTAVRFTSLAIPTRQACSNQCQASSVFPSWAQ